MKKKLEIIGLFFVCMIGACNEKTVVPKETVRSFTVKSWGNKVEFYYVDNDSIKSNICFSFERFKAGIFLRCERLAWVLPNIVQDTCAVTEITKDDSIGKCPGTKELLRLMSLCLKKASEKYDISTLSTMPVSLTDFPEIRVEYTNQIKKISKDPIRPNNEDVRKVIEATTLRRDLNKVLKPYGVKIKSIEILSDNKIILTPKKLVQESYNIDPNVIIPDSLLDIDLIIRMQKIQNK